MSFIDYNSYLIESEAEDENKRVTKDTLKTKYGWIDYYYEISDEYPDGVLVDMGGYVFKEYRGQGKLKDMIKELFSLFPEGTIVQMAIANRQLLHMFKRLGFNKVKRIAYWGQVSNAYESVITQDLIDSI